MGGHGTEQVLAKGAQANPSFIMIDGVILEVLGMFREYRAVPTTSKC